MKLNLFRGLLSLCRGKRTGGHGGCVYTGDGSLVLGVSYTQSCQPGSIGVQSVGRRLPLSVYVSRVPGYGN